MAESGSNIQPDIAAATNVNPDLIELYDREGTPSYWKREDLAKAERSGLSLTRYDLDAAFADWEANHEARAATIRQAVNESVRLGYIADSIYGPLNLAVGAEIDAYRLLMASLGATLPHESHIASLSEHITKHGGIDENVLPFEKRYEAIAAGLDQKVVKYWKDRGAADDAAAAKAGEAQ
jgi:hypothetical protein